MSYDNIHPFLRGNAMESRTATQVAFDTEGEAIEQAAMLRAHIEQSGIPARTAVAAHGGQWKVCYWRTDANTYPAPDYTTRMTGP